MYYFPLMFEVDAKDRLTFNPNGMIIDKERLCRAKDEIERFLRETTDNEIYLYNLEVEKQFPPRV